MCTNQNSEVIIENVQLGISQTHCAILTGTVPLFMYAVSSCNLIAYFVVLQAAQRWTQAGALCLSENTEPTCLANLVHSTSACRELSLTASFWIVTPVQPESMEEVLDTVGWRNFSLENENKRWIEGIYCLFLLIPSLFCDICKSKLADTRYRLLPGVFPICQTCRDGYPKTRAIADERTDESIDCGDACFAGIHSDHHPSYSINNTELALRSRNQRSLVVVGYPESNDAADLASSFNQSVLPALGMPPRFSVARAYRLGSCFLMGPRVSANWTLNPFGSWWTTCEGVEPKRSAWIGRCSDSPCSHA